MFKLERALATDKGREDLLWIASIVLAVLLSEHFAKLAVWLAFHFKAAIFVSLAWVGTAIPASMVIYRLRTLEIAHWRKTLGTFLVVGVWVLMTSSYLLRRIGPELDLIACIQFWVAVFLLICLLVLRRTGLSQRNPEHPNMDATAR